MKNVILAAVLLSGSAMAGAAGVVVDGSHALAHQCYMAARADAVAGSQRDACDRALTQEQLSADDMTATLVNRGVILMRGQRDYAGAIADYDRALAVSPGNPTVLINKAMAMLGTTGNAPRAIAMLDQALGSNPAEPWVAFYVRGYAHEEQGDLRAAYGDYRKAAALKPDFAAATDALSRFQVRPRRS